MTLMKAKVHDIAMRMGIVLAFIASATPAKAGGDGIVIANKSWSVAIQPDTMQFIGTPAGEVPVTIASARPVALAVSDLKRDGQAAQWRFPSEKIGVKIQLDGDALSVGITADDAGSFTWPRLDADASHVAYILPMFEGVYVPADDEPWAKFLIKDGPLDTTSGLSMPFFGLQCGRHTLTYVLTNQFNNELAFRSDQGKLASEFTHEFTRNHKLKEYGVRIYLGDASPVEPAKRYRKILVEQDQLVSLTKKIERTPEAAKLLGAAHIYLWGDGLITRYDFTDAKAFAAKLVAESNGTTASVGRRIWSLLSEDGRKLMGELAGKEWVDNYDKSRLAEELNGLLSRADFYDADGWHGVQPSAEAQSLLDRTIPALSRPELCRLNSLLLHAAFAEMLKPVDTWGDGLSPKMLHLLAAGGLDRLWLGSPDWKGLGDHPDLIRKAISLGYLIGPYDSFHGIHSPGATDTWETSQFDQKLYETGAVIKADGTPKKGFKQKGFILSPLAARPYVEKRVSKLMDEFRCNSWFIDCDADGELFDDYSPLHPQTADEDMHARLSRMAWIRDTFGAVIGSERGSSYAAATIHFAHGMMTPVMGWGDPDLMSNKSSPFYLGSYYPPDGPAVFMKRVPMKPEYRRVYADPRFRLPLYQIVFHGSVVTTHQWGSGSLKYTDEAHDRELLELLYNVPPLYHLNLGEWEKQKEAIKANYAVFSPLHREAGLLPMTGFEWLTADRMIQRTVFGDKLEIIANFGDEPYRFDSQEIPKHSMRAKWLDRGRIVVYSPEH